MKLSTFLPRRRRRTRNYREDVYITAPPVPREPLFVLPPVKGDSPLVQRLKRLAWPSDRSWYVIAVGLAAYIEGARPKQESKILLEQVARFRIAMADRPPEDWPAIYQDTYDALADARSYRGRPKRSSLSDAQLLNKFELARAGFKALRGAPSNERRPGVTRIFEQVLNSETPNDPRGADLARAYVTELDDAAVGGCRVHYLRCDTTMTLRCEVLASYRSMAPEERRCP